jgi:hypothetical protein
VIENDKLFVSLHIVSEDCIGQPPIVTAGKVVTENFRSICFVVNKVMTIGRFCCNLKKKEHLICVNNFAFYRQA